MSRPQAEKFIAKKINDAEELCFGQCVHQITVKPLKFQELCMENCLKKVMSGLDFLARFEKVGGVSRT